jgi:uncharacterized coiled-coil protein SlyX
MTHILFNSKYRVTQEFSKNPDYYDDFGLKGHEGIDLVPTTSDWTVKSLEDGVVVKDEDNAKSGAYGINVTVWHPKIKKATQYCHLSRNFVTIGQQVKKGQAIGDMGDTGNTRGAHVHLNLFEVDDNGIRLNRNNGYFGGIDPKPFLEQLMNEPTEKQVTVGASTFEELVSKSTKYDEFKAIGYDSVNKIKEKVEGLESTISTLDKTISNLNQLVSDKNASASKMQSELSSLKDQLLISENRIVGLEEKAKQLPLLKEENDYLVKQKENWSKAEVTFNRSIGQLKGENERLRNGAIGTLIRVVFEKALDSIKSITKK